MPQKTVTLATLLRGKNYKHFHEGAYLEFRRNIPREVSDDLGRELEELIDITTTSDGDKIERDRFEVEYDAVPLDDEAREPTKRKRLRLVEEEVQVRRLKKPTPALKKPAQKAAAGRFGQRG